MTQLKKKQKQNRPTWTKWTKWSECGKQCGGDRKYKHRYCLKPKACGFVIFNIF